MKHSLFFAILGIWFSISACSNGEEGRKPGHPATPGIKVAFIGDQGFGENAIAVLKLILKEGAVMVLHQGDFDYTDDPESWMKQIDNILGPTFPYFASVGNHDVKAWEGYQAQLLSRLHRIEGATCRGDVGVNSACTYKGIFFILSGVGTLGANHIEYLRKELSLSKADWKICSWHKNQRLMQVGGKRDAVGWDAYEVCRMAGAIIATGHEHSYSRTHLMSSFEFQTIASTSKNLTLSKGKSFVFVSGLGGFSIRPTVDGLGDNPWWASVYTSDENANYGALFCSFHHKGIGKKATCYFKDIDGTLVDSFELTSQLNPT